MKSSDFNDSKKELAKEKVHEELIKIDKEKESIKDVNQDILIPINLPKNSKERDEAQQNFNKYFNNLNSTNLAVIKESLSQCRSLSQYNIIISHQNLEFLLILAFRLGRSNELYNEVLGFASLILLNRPQRGIEIVDSEIIPQYFQLFNVSMNNVEVAFFDNLFASSLDVVKALNSKFNFIQIITQHLNNPSIPVSDFLNLLHIITEIIKTYRKIDINDISLFFFNTVIKKFIFAENESIFGHICCLYMSILEDCTTNDFFEFLINNENLDNQPNVTDYLLQRILKVRNQINREYILNIFQNFSCESPEKFTRVLYQNGILPKFLSLLPVLTNENSIVIMLQTMQNFFVLGYEVALQIASSNFTAAAIHFLNDGSFPSKLAAINYFCGLCHFSKDPNIQKFLVQNNIIGEIMEFFDIPKPKIWKPILVALYTNVQAAFASGCDVDNLFQHPLFQSIDIDDFYQSLCTIVDAINGYPKAKKEECKFIYQKALYFLDEIIEPILFNNNQV